MAEFPLSHWTSSGFDKIDQMAFGEDFFAKQCWDMIQDGLFRLVWKACWDEIYRWDEMIYGWWIIIVNKCSCFDVPSGKLT